MAYGVALRVWGDFACFTRPEMKVERVSYDVMTPSAARGILDAIYWKPSIRWRIDRIHVMNPIRFFQIRRNELSGVVSSRVETAMKTGEPFYTTIEDHRQQRAAMILRDVDYIIEAHFNYLSDTDRNDGKHLDSFRRRAISGQCHHRPYLGCREFPCDFKWMDPSEIPDSELGDRDLGWMLWDVDFEDLSPMFFRADMKQGIVQVPDEGLVRR